MTPGATTVASCQPHVEAGGMERRLYVRVLVLGLAQPVIHFY